MFLLKILLLCTFLSASDQVAVSSKLATNPPESDGQCSTAENVQEIVNQGTRTLEYKQEDLYRNLIRKMKQTISESFGDSAHLYVQIEELVKNYTDSLHEKIVDNLNKQNVTVSQQLEELKVATGELKALQSTTQLQMNQLRSQIQSKVVSLNESASKFGTEQSRHQFPPTEAPTDVVSTTSPKRTENELAITSTESLKGSYQHPVNSCRDIPEGSPSGDYFLVNNCNKTPVKMHCDMTRSACNSTGGWARVVNLDMTNSSHQCPVGTNQISRSTAPRRLCGRTASAGCTSVAFPTYSISYSVVCGKIKGYHYGQPFAYYYSRSSEDIESHYVDGISLTYGNPGARKHIWTFAAGSDETSADSWVCPCTRTDLTYQGRVPSFVGQDYFCDTANHHTSYVGSVEFYDDPLWDGDGCISTSSCCCFNSPPWFCKELPQPTTDDIELRLCNHRSSDSDTLFEVVELYIK